MKVFIDLTSLADNLSGIERYAAELSLELLKNTNNEYVLAFKREIHPYIKKHISNNTRCIVIKDCNKLWFSQVRFPRTIRRIDADCYLFLAFPPPLVTRKKNMIVTIHDAVAWDCPETMSFKSRLYFRVSQLNSVKKCSSIITISQFSKTRIMKRLYNDSSKINVVYCGVDGRLTGDEGGSSFELIRDKYDLPEKYLLSLSTIEPRKNLRMLIRSYSELVENHLISMPLVLAGRKGWKTKKLLDDISLYVRKKILFTGFVDDEDLHVLYRNAKLFLFPSMYEGFGLPPLEALACGADVLASDASSIPEVLGNAAYYFRNQDPTSLKEQMIRIMDGNVETINTSEKKRQLDRFRWDREGLKLQKILQESIR